MADKTALVVSGGGSKTAYLAGLMNGLASKGFTAPNMIFLASGSSVSGVHWLVGDYQALEKAWKDPAFVGDKNFINLFRFRTAPLQWNPVDTDFLIDNLCSKNISLDLTNYLNSQAEIFFGVTNCETGIVERIRNPLPYDLPAIYKATMAVPWILPPVEFNGKLYCDSHNSTSTILAERDAISKGANKIVTLETGNHNFLTTKLEPIWVAFKSETFRFNYQAQRNLIKFYQMFDLPASIERVVLKPEGKLPIGTFSRDPKLMKLAYETGYYQAIKDKRVDRFL